MPTRSVYLETTIVSYLCARPSRDLIVAADQELTREWWDLRRQGYELYVSRIVADEAAAGDHDAARRRGEALASVPRLAVTDDAVRLARELLEHHALPPKAAEDALHIAVATVHGMDYLLTWNCAHIANADRLPAVRMFILDAGYECPWICTPKEMMGDLE